MLHRGEGDYTGTMPDRLLRQLTVWLCLVAALFLGTSPGNGWVLCFEPDGAVAVELATASNGCGGCPGDAGALEEVAFSSSESAGCPCIDIPLVLKSEHDRLQLKRIEVRASDLATILPATLFAFEPALAKAYPTLAPPQPAPSLALIRSVVLLV